MPRLVWVGGLHGEKGEAQRLGMMNITELASVPSDHLVPFTDQLRLAVALTWPGSRAPPAITPTPICAATWRGAASAAWIRWPHGVRTWSCTSAGCRRSAGSSPPLSPGGSR